MLCIWFYASRWPCFAAIHFTRVPYSSSNIPCSAMFGHLRTLFIFCLSHLTLSHNSPSPVFSFEAMCNAIEVLRYFSSLMLCSIVERIRVKNCWRVLLSDQLVLESGRPEHYRGDAADFLLTNVKSQKFRGSGENQKQEGIGAALINLLVTCTVHI